MEEFFLYLGDLPLHPFAVHYAVVLFPLTALMVALAAIWPRFRAKYLGLSVIGLALSIPFVFIAQQSGEALGEAYYEPDAHEEYGEMMMPVALATLAIAVLFWLAIKYRWPSILLKALGFLAVSAAVGAVAITFVVGHSGAEATWGNTLSAATQSFDMREL